MLVTLLVAVTLPLAVVFGLGVYVLVFNLQRESEDLGRGIDGIIQQLEQIARHINEINMG